MDYHGLVKRLQVPYGYIAPRELSLPLPGRLLLQHRDPARVQPRELAPDPGELTAYCPFDRMLS
jgi:hypothetical protein